MGSLHGVINGHCTRLGISRDEYEARRSAGEKWCTGCKAWHPIEAFPVDRSRADGRRAKCLAAERGKPRTPRNPVREAARKAVAYEVRCGRLASPNALLCVDCGHMGLDRRHEFDHHLGYEREHWLHVEPVCTICHADREKKRRG